LENHDSGSNAESDNFPQRCSEDSIDEVIDGTMKLNLSAGQKLFFFSG
jgi:hypothetical protein